MKNFEVSSNTFITVTRSADVDFPIADVESLGSNKLFFLNHFSKEVRFSQIAPGLPPFIADFKYFDL